MIKNKKRNQSEEDHSRVFGQIRDGLLETIELEKALGLIIPKNQTLKQITQGDIQQWFGSTQ